MLPTRPALTLLAIALAVPLAGAEATKGKPVTLKAGPLAYDGIALTPAVIAANCRSSRYQQVLSHTSTGTSARTANQLEFKGETSLTIAGTTLTFAASAPDERLTVAVGKGKPVQLKAKGAGFEAFPLPVGKRQLAVAIPVAMITSRGTFLWWMNGGASRGTWDGADLSLFDEDCDGAYRTGTDLVSVGSGAVFVPLGERLAGPKGLFRVTELKEDGSRLVLEPDESPAGKLTVKGSFAGAEAHLALDAGGLDAVAVQGRTIAAPVGSAQLRHGLLINPARKAPAALILAGTFKAVEVAADQPATLAVGGPFAVTFQPRSDGGKVKIDAFLGIVGAAGETYHNFKWVGPPQVLINGKGIGAFGFG